MFEYDSKFKHTADFYLDRATTIADIVEVRYLHIISLVQSRIIFNVRQSRDGVCLIAHMIESNNQFSLSYGYKTEKRLC